MEWVGVGGVQGRRSSTRSPTSRSAASSACAAASSTPDTPAPLGSLDDGAHRLRGVLPDAEPDAHRRGAAPRRLGPRRADDPARAGSRDPAKGHLGLGFREYSAKPATSRLKRWPPVPASQPNYVGIDGVLEGLCPPYVTDMDAAVDQVLEEKFGPGGAVRRRRGLRAGLQGHGDAPRPTCSNAGHHPPEAIEYTKEICRYLVETYGRFPAHTDAVPPAGHLGAVLAPGDRVLRAVRQPARTSRRQAEGREIWGRH